MHGEIRSQGATVVAQSGTPGPLDLVNEVIKKHPAATRNERFRFFLDELDGHEDYKRAIYHYFFVNMHDRALDARVGKHSGPRKPAADAAVVERLTQRVADIVLSDLILPNGKALRDATFADCAKAGGFFAKIAKRGKPNQIVGKVLSEDQLRAIRS